MAFALTQLSTPCEGGRAPDAFGTPPRIRTAITCVLSAVPLPIGLVEHWNRRRDLNPHSPA